MQGNDKGFAASVSRFVETTYRDDPYILIIAGSILVLAAALWLIWFFPPVLKLRRDLRRLAGQLRGVKVLDGAAAPGLPTSLGATRHPGLKEAWHETVGRIVSLPMADGTRSAAFIGSPRDLWTVPRLLAGRLNLNLADAVPNLLVGVGLLFTFLFLTLALAGATAALAPADGGAAAGAAQGQPTLIEATRELLRTAGGKFVTSLAGLLASVIWTVVAKWQLATLDKACDDVLRELERLAPFTGSEKALALQFGLMGAMQEKLTAQHATSQNIEETLVAQRDLTKDLVDASSELLNRAEEQSATLKRFSTDFAVSLGTAIDSAMAPRFEAMTQQLVASLNTLTERIGTINQDSLDRMAQEHAKKLSEATKQEMDTFKTALVELAGHLNTAGGAINQGADEAAKVLSGAGQALGAEVAAAGQRMAEGAAAAGEKLGDAIAGAGDNLRGSIESAAQQLEKAGAQAAASIEGASTSMGRQGEAMGAAMAAAAQQFGSSTDNAARRWQDGMAESVKTLNDGATQAAATLSASSDRAAQAFATAASDLVQRAQTFGNVMSEKLAEVASATSGITAEVKALTTAARGMADQGIRSAQQLSDAMSRMAPMVKKMGDMAEGWASLVQDLRDAAKDVRDATAPIAKVTGTMNTLSERLAAQAPQALSAIQQVTQLLETSAQQTRDAMLSSRAAMMDTSKVLHQTVASMTEGVQSYTGQVVKLHQELDASLAKALTGISGAIGEMSEAIEDLNDAIGRLPERR